MKVGLDVLRTHLDYTSWASGRLVEACSQLADEELNRDFGTADRSVLGTLAHVFAADRAWLGRIHGRPPAIYLDPERDLKLDTVKNEWPVVLEGWRKWAAGLAQEDVEGLIAYQDLKGQSHETPIWQIVLHVVNHATHHRGQAAGFLRSMGHKPPPLDLIAYYRGLSLAKNA